MVSKAQVVGDLENRIQQLQTSLAEAQAEIQVKTSSVQALEQDKADLEVTYKGELEASNKERDELSGSTAVQLTAANEKVGKCSTYSKTPLNHSLKGRRVTIHRAS